MSDRGDVNCLSVEGLECRSSRQWEREKRGKEEDARCNRDDENGKEEERREGSAVAPTRGCSVSLSLCSQGVLLLLC